MTTITKLTIEEVEAYAMDLAVPRGKNSDDFLYQMACQLVDTMRENERIREKGNLDAMEAASLRGDNDYLREALENINIYVWADTFRDIDAKLDAISKEVDSALATCKQSLKGEWKYSELQGTEVFVPDELPPQSSEISDK